MRVGPSPAPRLRLTPKFREAVLSAMAAGSPSWKLGMTAGWPQPTEFSKVLHARRVKATPLLISRLTRVAEAIKFDGDIFLRDEEEEQRIAQYAPRTRTKDLAALRHVQEQIERVKLALLEVKR